MTLRTSKRMFRPCDRCNKMFERTGKGQRLCLSCWIKARCSKNKRGYRTPQSKVWDYKKHTFNPKEYRKEMKATALELGNCTSCFREKDNPKFKFCSVCRLNSRKYNKKWRAKKKKL